MAYFTIDADGGPDRGTAAPTDDVPPKGAGGIAGARPNLIAHFPPRVALQIGDTDPRRRRHGQPPPLRQRDGRCVSARALLSPARSPVPRSPWRPSPLAGRDGAAAPPSGAELEALAQPPAYTPFASQRIYFVMPDRYANGDPSNDRGGKSGGRSVTGFDPVDTGWYHGGDLKGLTGTLHRPAAGPAADQRPRLHRDLGDARRGPADGAGLERRLPRLLGPRLHRRRPAPRQRGRLRARSPTARTGSA